MCPSMGIRTWFPVCVRLLPVFPHVIGPLNGDLHELWCIYICRGVCCNYQGRMKERSLRPSMSSESQIQVDSVGSGGTGEGSSYHWHARWGSHHSRGLYLLRIHLPGFQASQMELWVAAKLLPDDSYQQGGARAAPMTGERIEADRMPEMTQKVRHPRCAFQAGGCLKPEVTWPRSSFRMRWRRNVYIRPGIASVGFQDEKKGAKDPLYGNPSAELLLPQAMCDTGQAIPIITDSRST